MKNVDILHNKRIIWEAYIKLLQNSRGSIGNEDRIVMEN